MAQTGGYRHKERDPATGFVNLSQAGGPERVLEGHALGDMARSIKQGFEDGAGKYFVKFFTNFFAEAISTWEDDPFTTCSGREKDAVRAILK